MRIEWANGARVNLQELDDYIAEDSPQNAEGFLARLFDIVEKLADQPRLGRRVPEPIAERMCVSCSFVTIA